jgi:hypothetical protein
MMEISFPVLPQLFHAEETSDPIRAGQIVDQNVQIQVAELRDSPAITKFRNAKAAHSGGKMSDRDWFRGSLVIYNKKSFPGEGVNSGVGYTLRHST